MWCLGMQRKDRSTDPPADPDRLSLVSSLEEEKWEGVTFEVSN